MNESQATVRDRITHLNLEYPNKKQAWALGSNVRAEYVRLTGKHPEKKLSEKTSGKGSHCFAVYPKSFWPKMDKIITNSLNSLQGLLPFKKGT